MPAADDFARLVSADLDSFVTRKRQALIDLEPDIDPFLDAALSAGSGGKRLRAAFCHAGWVAAGGDPEDAGLRRAAGSLEWLQASALVHDDVMDGSDVRRGRPSAHKAFEAQHRAAGWGGDARHYGLGGAILLGDLLLSWCDEAFWSCGLPQTGLGAAAPYLDDCKTEVVAGQFLDLVEQARGESTVDGAMRVVRFKSAKYTVERPLHVGVALAGGSPELVEAMSAFGLPLGEAFQLRDDVLGVFGDPAVTGKPAGDDLREGKRTVLVAHAATRAAPAQQAVLERHLGDDRMDAAALEALRAIITGTGALEQVESDICDLERRAESALESAPVASETARQALRTLAGRAIRRTR